MSQEKDQVDPDQQIASDSRNNPDQQKASGSRNESDQQKDPKKEDEKLCCSTITRKEQKEVLEGTAGKSAEEIIAFFRNRNTGPGSDEKSG